MDFVVLGFGFGALAVLIGLGVRDLGPLARRLPGPNRDDLPWSEVARRVAWGRTCRAAGLLVTIGGAAICLVTLLVLVAGAGDGLGMAVVVGALLAAAAGLAGWALLYTRQGGPRRAPGSGRGVRGAVGDRRRRPVAASGRLAPHPSEPVEGSAVRRRRARAGSVRGDAERTVGSSDAGGDLRPARSSDDPAPAPSIEAEARTIAGPVKPPDESEAPLPEVTPRRAKGSR